MFTYSVSRRSAPPLLMILACTLLLVLAGAHADLEGYWSFNEGAGTSVSDSSGNANDGSFAVSSWTTGQSGDAGDNALNAVSGSQSVNIPPAGFANIGSNNAVTLSLWLYGDPALQPRTNTTTQGMNGGTRIVFTHVPWSNSVVYWDSGDRTNTGGRPASDYEGSWSYWTFVKDGNTDFGGIYRNGTLLASRNDRTANLSGLTQLLLAPNYRGFMDDVAIYSHAISTDTITAMATGTFADGVTYTDPIVGSNAYTKASPGTATLSAANKYIGLTRIGINATTSGGTLVFTDSGAFSSGQVRYERDGTLEFGANSLSVSNFLFVPNWGGTVRTLRLDQAGTNSGTWSGPIDVRFGTGQGFVQDVGTDDTLTLSGVISTGAGGGAGLTKSGDGTLIVSNNSNTYTGNTTINAGTLRIDQRNALGNTGWGTIVASGATLQLNHSGNIGDATTISGSGVGGIGAIYSTGANSDLGGSTVTMAADATIGGTARIDHNGQITDGGSGYTLTKTGSFDLVRSGAANFSHLVINQGAYTLTGNSAFPGGVGTSATINSATTLWANRTITNSPNLILNNGSSYSASRPSANSSSINGTITVNGSVTFQSWSTAHTINSDISGAGNMALISIVNNQNSAAYIFAGNNTYTGSTTVGNSAVNVGKMTLQAGSATAFGTNSAFTVTANSTLQLNGNSNSIGSLAGPGTVENANASGATLTTGADGSSTTFSGVVQDGTGGGALALAKSGGGIQTLSNTNTYSGATTVSAGTLSVTGANNGTGAVAVNSGGTLGGTGSLAGLVTVNSGGHVAAGTSVGTLTLSGGMTLNDGAEIDAELTLGGTTDLIDITGGTLTGSGAAGVTVNVTVTGATPSGASTYALIDWSAAAESGVDLGDFTLAVAAGPAAVGYRLAIVGQQLILEVSPTRTVFRFQ